MCPPIVMLNPPESCELWELAMFMARVTFSPIVMFPGPPTVTTSVSIHDWDLLTTHSF